MPFFLPVCQSLLENSLNINSVFLICISSDTRPSSGHIRLFAQIAFQFSRKYRFIFIWNLYFGSKQEYGTYVYPFYLTADSASIYMMAHSATLFSLPLPSLVSLVSNRCFPLCFDYHELHKKLLLTSQI